MITEDYCSNEVAELLREKGFKEPVTELNRLLFKEGEKPVLKITLQKAMKWLRLVHDIMISPYALSLGYYFEIFDLTNRDITGCKPLYEGNDYYNIDSVEWQDYVIDTAKHFFDLGLKAQKGE